MANFFPPNLLPSVLRQVFFNNFRKRKAMVACTKEEEESERLRGEGDMIRFIDLRFKRSQVVGFRKARRKQDVP